MHCLYFSPQCVGPETYYHIINAMMFKTGNQHHVANNYYEKSLYRGNWRN